MFRLGSKNRIHAFMRAMQFAVVTAVQKNNTTELMLCLIGPQIEKSYEIRVITAQMFRCAYSSQFYEKF